MLSFAIVDRFVVALWCGKEKCAKQPAFAPQNGDVTLLL
jgi:hypothetical protein